MSYRSERADYFFKSEEYFTGSNHENINFDNYTVEDLKKLWKKTLDKGMHGLCFSLYEDGQGPGSIITESQVERSINIIKPYTNGEDVSLAVPSKDNAMKYYLDIETWGKHTDIDLFYFSSFDESWKVDQEGDVGARWGIWDKDENIKYS